MFCAGVIDLIKSSTLCPAVPNSYFSVINLSCIEINPKMQGFWCVAREGYLTFISGELSCLKRLFMHYALC